MGKLSQKTIDYAMENPIINPETGCFTRKFKECLVGATGTKPKTRDQEMYKPVFKMINGPMPKDKPDVCHKCDNPMCFNPSHLFAGNDEDNFNDMYNKGRGAYGPNNLKGAKDTLSLEDVLEIRRLYSEDQMRQTDIARKFGVASSTIYRIIRGRRWRHLNQPDLYPNSTAYKYAKFKPIKKRM